MRLKRLRLKNIRSYIDEEIVFPEGSTLLAGDIGTGKTSVLLAIEYALFGLQPGQRGSSLLTNGKEIGEVMLEFETEGQNVIVERKLKRGSKTVSQDYTAITIDSEKTESSITEIKTKILELLNYPPEFIKRNNLLYRYTVYTPQEQMKHIILEEPESRLNVLRHIFGIEKYKRIKENLSVLTLKLREASRTLQSEIRNLDENKNKLESNKKFINIVEEKIGLKLSDLGKTTSERKIIESSLSEIEKKVKEKETFQTEIEKTGIMLNSKREQLSREESSMKELELKLSQQKETFNIEVFESFIAEIKNKKHTLEELNKIYMEVASGLNSLEIKRQEDLEKKNRIFKIDICPTCLQDVSENHKHNILNDAEKQLKDAEKQEVSFKEKMIDLSKNLEEQKLALERLEEKKAQLEILRIKEEELKLSQEKVSILISSKENLSKDIDFLEKHIRTLKQSTLEFTKFDNFLKIKQEELKQAFQSEKKIEIEIAEFRKELEITRREIFEIEGKIKETEKTRDKLNEVLEIEGWLSKDFLELINFTEKNIMLTLRNEFSKLFDKWFSILTTDSFHVQLDENFTPIITQGEFELDYSYLSGGERTAVALAYRLSLNQTLNSLLSRIKTQDLVILDEPTDGFSDQQLTKVRDILQELNARQLIIVSHEPKIESFVENVIRLKKDGGVSRKG